MLFTWTSKCVNAIVQHYVRSRMLHPCTLDPRGTLVTSEHFSWQYQYVPFHTMDLYGRKGSEMPTSWLLSVTITSAFGWLRTSVLSFHTIKATNQAPWLLVWRLMTVCLESDVLTSPLYLIQSLPSHLRHRDCLSMSTVTDEWLAFSSLNLFRDYNRHNGSSWWYFLLWLVEQTPFYFPIDIIK